MIPEVSDVLALAERLRDLSGDVVSDIAFDTSRKSTNMRWYFMGMSDAYATLVSLLVNGDPEIALDSNMMEIWERMTERGEENG